MTELTFSKKEYKNILLDKEFMLFVYLLAKGRTAYRSLPFLKIRKKNFYHSRINNRYVGKEILYRNKNTFKISHYKKIKIDAIISIPKNYSTHIKYSRKIKYGEKYGQFSINSNGRIFTHHILLCQL